MLYPDLAWLRQHGTNPSIQHARFGVVVKFRFRGRWERTPGATTEIALRLAREAVEGAKA